MENGEDGEDGEDGEKEDYLEDVDDVKYGENVEDINGPISKKVNTRLTLSLK